LTDKGITGSEARMLLDGDISAAIGHLENSSRTQVVYKALDAARQVVLISMSVNLGFVGLLGFKRMWKALEAGDFDLAGTEILDSLYHRQLPARVELIAGIMLNPEMLLEALEGGPQTMAEIVRQVGRSGEDDRDTISRIVREMSLTGLVCHATTKGPWYHNAEHTFARVDRWLPEPPNDITEREVGTCLAEMYLEAYGPASVSDFAYWSGMRVREAAPIFEQISGSTEEVRIEGKRGKYLILGGDTDALSPAGEVPSWAKLLPQFDALIMGHRDKSRFLDPQLKGEIFLPRADVAATILVDGQVRGTWSMRKKKEWELALSPFHGPESDERELVEGEIDDLRRFTGFDIDVVWRRPS